MKNFIGILFSVLLILLLSACSLDDANGTKEEVDTPNLIINEFMASNDAAVADPDDDLSGDNSVYDDWFEIYNAESEAVDVGGMYVTDNLESPDAYQIPKNSPAVTTIPPGGFLVIWADSEPEQGPNHADFALSGGGEAIGIVMPDGRTFIDQLTYTAQQTDYSYGRNPDGSDNWQIYMNSTPGASNTGASTNLPPQISNVSISPETLTESTPVIISAKVTDTDDNLQTVVLTYGEADAITQTKTMTKSDTVYQASLGTFADATRIFFFITATDDEAASSKTDTLSFAVGYIPPVLYINEFLASNDSATVDPDEDGNDGDPQEDWIEIYNPGTEAVDIGGMYISDKLSDLTSWQIPATDPSKTTIPAGGFLVLWADKETHQGVLHVDIKLSGDGEDIVLTAPNGTTVIDSYTYSTQTTDVSFGRLPDGSDNWTTLPTLTPGASNQ